MATFARYVNPNTDAVQRIADTLSAYNEKSKNSIQPWSEIVN
jgi:hypothetical protein